MPLELTRTQLAQLAVLILCVPVQYLLTRSSNEVERQFALNKVIKSLSDLKEVFNWDTWRKWCNNVGLFTLDDESLSDKPSPEVLHNKSKNNGYYGTSDDVRSPRPPHVKYRVGQVVFHKLHKYRGVIIGWDETAKAPEQWLREMHPKDKPHWRKLPNYAVLVDTRDRFSPQMTYMVEENVKVITNTRIMHPLLEHYFENFDGAQYLPRPWLKRIYPHD